LVVLGDDHDLESAIFAVSARKPVGVQECSLE
jgi:hypothetical protein